MPLSIRTLVWLVGACLFLMSSACTKSDDGTVGDADQVATPTPVDPRAIVEASAAALRSQAGFHFELEDDSQTTFVLPGLILLNAKGDSVGTDRVRVLMGVRSSDITAFLEMELRVIDDLAYVRDPINRQWGTVDAVLLPVNFVDLGDTLARLLLKGESLQYGGLVREKGRLWHRVSGTLSSREFGILFYAVVKTGTTNLEALIDPEDFLPYEIVASGRMLETDRDDAQRVLRLSKFGTTVDVTPP